MADDKSEAKHLVLMYRNIPNILAEQLVRICLNKPRVVYEVYKLLDNYETLEVSCSFISKISYSTLQKLVKTNQGLYLCELMYDWISGGLGVAIKPFPCKNIQSSLMTLKTSIDNQERESNSADEPRKLIQAEIDTYKAKPGGKNFNMDIIWELPDGGTGFVTYNRNDVKADGLDQIGTKETVEAIIRLAREWAVNSDNKNGRKLQIGDISRPGGLDTSQHKGHEDGKIVDIRLLRNDSATGKGANLNYHSSSYDQDLTKKFIRMVKKLYPSIFNANQGLKIINDENKGLRKSNFMLFL